MAVDYKIIVIGRGMMGSAAAKYLARETDGVALLGPDEPTDPAHHTGVFASHYDEARITRTIDPDPVWARLAHRSIARYGEIAAESGLDFYTESGCLLVGPGQGAADSYVARIRDAAARVGIAPDLLDDAALAARFSYFRFEDGSEGVHEPDEAGYINPRRLVAAQSMLAERAGATLVRGTACDVRETAGGVTVATEDGRTLAAETVIVAAGGFSIARGLLPAPLDLTVYARTVAFFEIAPELAPDLAGMPSLIHHPADPTRHIYMLPPVRYPDGRTYLKIGGDPDDLRLKSEPEIRTWFRSGGRDSTRLHLGEIARGLVPGLEGIEPTMAACVTSFTPSGYPAVDYASRRIAVLTGGCGAAAKSSDEIGRLGARLLIDGGLKDDGYGVDFSAAFL